jgi:ribosomal-protein-alanine N-acetyltransferase
VSRQRGGKDPCDGPRVLLCAPSPRHEKEFLEAARRSRALHRHFADPPRTSEAFRALLHRARRPSCASHLVLDARSRALVGVVNLNEIVRGSFRCAYLGYYAFHPHSGRGYMSAGLELVLQRAFRELGLHRVEANIQPDNERSIALVERFGFRREGFSPRYLKIRGRWRDHERWALLREEHAGTARSSGRR